MTNDSGMSIAKRVDNFLKLIARDNDKCSMETWLFTLFPQGLDHMTQWYDRESESSKKAIFSDPESANLSFSDPSFSGKFSEAQEVARGFVFGAISQPLERIQDHVKAHDQTLIWKKFFETEFFPRLKALRDGGPLQEGDFELFYRAEVYGGRMAQSYDKIVSDDLKPDQSALRDYILFTSDMRHAIGKPKGFNAHAFMGDINTSPVR